MIIYIILLAIPFIMSFALLKSFSKVVRIIISISLMLIAGITSYVISIYGLYLIDTYSNVGDSLRLAVLFGLMFHFAISLLVFVPITSSVINKYNIDKISKIKFIVYMTIIIVLFIAINLMF